MSINAVHVTGISSNTTETHLHDFFSFCGKITNIDFKPPTATIYFEKPTAAKTSLMLNGGALDGAAISVHSETDHHDAEEQQDHHTKPIEQSEKPRAGIAAEYLAKGYMLSDSILKRAIEIDDQQGISKRFINYMNHLDSSAGSRAIGRNKTISEHIKTNVEAAKRQVSEMDKQGGYSHNVRNYYAKALASPLGQKVLSFYTSTSKQVSDIHDEAKRIAAQNKEAASSAQTTSPTQSAPPLQPTSPAQPVSAQETSTTQDAPKEA